MGVRFRAGSTSSCALYVDVPSNDWRNLVARGWGAPEARASIEHTFAKRGRVESIQCECTPRSAGADTTISARVAWTPSGDVESGVLDADVIAQLNKFDAAAPFKRHVSATSNLVLAPVSWGAALVSWVAPDASSRLYRNALGIVIDEGSIRAGVDRSVPPSSSSALGRASTVVAGEARSSTDPSRDGRTPASTAATDAGQAVGGAVTPPAWLIATLVGVAGVAALVAVGFAARGLAQAKREIS
jgi:hypothetical protein